ncbi:PA2169 family four-helix-bundle protein [Flavobacteriaceae bacterium]|nr:PA2169 family four-helix-bundle protein [Flavobacteriaceae bacterium]
MNKILMSKHNRHIAIMEKLLTHLKNAKLEYLKAADRASTSAVKRFFNQQALIRNRFFQEVLSELQSLGMSYDDLVVSKFNFDQLLISTIDNLKASAFEKCLEADRTLLGLYQNLFDQQFKNSKLAQHLSSIKAAYDQSQAIAAESLHKKEINSES